MSVIDSIQSFAGLVTSSFENVMGMMERVHESSAQMSMDLLKEIGFPAGPVDAYGTRHNRALHITYGSIVEVNNEFGEMLVRQAENLNEYLLAEAPVTERLGITRRRDSAEAPTSDSPEEDPA